MNSNVERFGYRIIERKIVGNPGISTWTPHKLGIQPWRHLRGLMSLCHVLKSCRCKSPKIGHLIFKWVAITSQNCSSTSVDIYLFRIINESKETSHIASVSKHDLRCESRLMDRRQFGAQPLPGPMLDYYLHIEAETKWSPFTRRHLQAHFLENVYISVQISLKFVPNVSNQIYSSIGSDNVLAPSRRQDTIWNNGS